MFKCIKTTFYILSTAIAYWRVIDAKHFLNDPHCDKNAIMSQKMRGKEEKKWRGKRRKREKKEGKFGDQIVI